MLRWSVSDRGKATSMPIVVARTRFFTTQNQTKKPLLPKPTLPSNTKHPFSLTCIVSGL